MSFIFVLGLALLGLGLRIWGADFGLPYAYHIDESAYIADAVKFVSTGDLQPTNWANPTLFSYLLSLIYGITYLLGGLPDNVQSLQDIQTLYNTDPSILYLIARWLSAEFGAITIILVYWLGQCVIDRKTGVLAAFFLTLCFLHTRDSHYAVSDITMVFFFTWAILACALFVKKRQSHWLYMAGVVIGLAIATKFTAAVLVVIPLLAWLYIHYDGSWRSLLKALFRHEIVMTYGLMGMAFLVVVPYAVLDFPALLQSLRDHYGMGKIGFGGYSLDSDGGWVFYLKTLIWGMGLPLALVCGLSVIYALTRHTDSDLLLLVPIVLLYLYMGNQKTFFARFILPIIPLITVSAARMIWEIADKLPASTTLIRPAAVGLFAGIIMLPSTLAVAQHNQLLLQTDTRTLAKEWIETNVPEGSRIYAEWHTPHLSTPEKTSPASSRVYNLSSTHMLGLFENNLEYYQAECYAYLIASSYIYEIPRMSAEEQAARQDFYAQLDCAAQLVYQVQPYRNQAPAYVFDQLYGPALDLHLLERPGPTIKVYALQPSSDNQCD